MDRHHYFYVPLPYSGGTKSTPYLKILMLIISVFIFLSTNKQKQHILFAHCLQGQNNSYLFLQDRYTVIVHQFCVHCEMKLWSCNVPHNMVKLADMVRHCEAINEWCHRLPKRHTCIAYKVC